MARLRAEIKRGFLRTLWRKGSAAGLSVQDMLAAFQDNGYQWIRSGRIIISTSGGGYSSSFPIPSDTRELSETEVFSFSEELFAIMESALATDNTLTGDNLITNMLADDRMQTVRQVMLDSTMIRYPTYGPAR